MNVFLRELAARRIGIIAWSGGMILMIWTSMVKFQTLTADSAATSALLKQMPDTIKTIFGMNGLDATTLGGYYGICFLFILIMLAVHAALLGSGLLTNEPLTKTTEFLYTKPKSRQRIVTAKLLAGLFFMAILWGVTYLASLVSITLYATLSGFEQTLWIFMLAAAVVQLLCFCLGMGAAATLRAAGSAGKLMTAFVFTSYALSLVSQLQGYDWLRYITFFRYFDALDILHSGTLKLHCALCCLVVSALALLVVYFFYPRRDLRT